MMGYETSKLIAQGGTTPSITIRKETLESLNIKAMIKITLMNLHWVQFFFNWGTSDHRYKFLSVLGRCNKEEEWELIEWFKS